MAKPKPAATDARRVPIQPPLPLRLAQRVARSRRFWRNAAGAILIAAGAITLMTLLGLNAGGIIGDWAALLRQAFGVGAWLLCAVMIAAGIPLVLNTPIAFGAGLLIQIIAAEVAFLSLLALVHALSAGADGLALAQAGAGGGAFGWVLSRLAGLALGADTAPSGLVSIAGWGALLLISAFIAARPLLARAMPEQARPAREAQDEPGGIVVIGEAPVPAPAAPQPTALELEPPALEAPALEAPAPRLARARPADAASPPAARSKAAIVHNEEKKAAAKTADKARKPRKPAPPRDDALPPPTLLKPAKENRINEADVRRMADVIETTLSHFGLAGKVVEIRRGPTVTQFGIEPGYLERGAQNRDKVLQKFRAAAANAVYDAVRVDLSVDRATVVVDVPAAIADARESGFRSLLKALLADNNLAAAVAEGDRKSGRALFEVGADAERKQKIRASQVSSLQRGLAASLADALFHFDASDSADLLTERLLLRFPAGIADAVDLKDRLQAVMMDLGLAGTIDLDRRSSQAVIEWQKQAQKVRVGQIASLQNDFALALEASSIRIEAPIPGRGLVGIEVPNAGVGLVDVRGVMESEAFQKISQASTLAIALGRDVAGASVAADLGRMPHLLIAGTTGSGKSVCISAIVVCLTMANRPEDLKLVMIDPKMVELSRFVGLPHIIGKPESDLERIPGVLRWVTREMDGRYKKFAEAGARNLADYNDMLKRRGEETLPRIVVLVDEMADLMLQSPIETEKTICRLAQMARATGIHLVVATQRPSVDVITGLIKANFPARISFAVASSTDSRVILDQVGAETLLGRGDMLFLNPESGHPQRLQGCFVSDREVEGLVSWWRKQIEIEKARAAAEEPAEEQPDEEAGEAYVANRKPDLETPWELEVAELAGERAMASAGKAGRGAPAGAADDGGDDDLVKRAIDIIQSTGNASTSLLQRKLRIGYPRAARLMEELQEMGYVGGASKQAGRGREVKARDDADGM